MISRLASRAFGLSKCRAGLFSSTQARSITTEVEPHSMHKRLVYLYDLNPELNIKNYIAPNALIAGEVYLDDSVTIWDKAVIRGDLNAIRISHMACIKEGVSISTVSSIPLGLPAITLIGRLL